MLPNKSFSYPLGGLQLFPISLQSFKQRQIALSEHRLFSKRFLIFVNGRCEVKRSFYNVCHEAQNEARSFYIVRCMDDTYEKQ